MFRPRWIKVFNDLWSNKSRTALVVASIFIGVFATGVISGARSIVVSQLHASYLKTQPANAIIRLSNDDSFDDDMVQTVRKMDGVEEAQGRRSTTVKLQAKPDKWESFQLTAIPDFGDIRINQFKTVQGASKPRDKEVLLERSSMKILGASVGENLLIEDSNGKQRTLHIAGVVHDLSVRPTSMSGTYYGYITMSTIESLGQKPDYTQLLVRVKADTQKTTGVAVAQAAGARGQQQSAARTNATTQSQVPDRAQIVRVMENVMDKLKKSGREPHTPRGPGGGYSNDHWATSFISNLSMVMSVLGVLSLFLSGFLVTNTISALLAQQVKQIGIMKAIGARSSQIITMYILLSFGFGIISMLVAIPATIFVTGIFVGYIANYFNFDLSGVTIPTNVLLLQAFVSLFIPVIASLAPVLMGTRVTIREALSSDGTQQVAPKKHKMRQILVRFFKRSQEPKQETMQQTKPDRDSFINKILTRFLDRPLLLSVRNTFRRKARVTLTLLTLTIGGLIFVGIFSIRNSLLQTLNEFTTREFNFDLIVGFNRSYNDYYVIDVIKRIPGITSVEAWSNGSAVRVYSDSSESQDISLSALPPTTTMVNPVIISGRWLLPQDESAIVVTTGVLEDDPDITVGSNVRLKINDKETTWRVVGVATGIGDSREAYVNYNYFTRFTGEVGKTRMLRIQIDRSRASAITLAKALPEYLADQGLDVDRVFSMQEMQQRMMTQFNFIVLALMVMALLMAIVGGLGLAGTMSLNVIERTKEIGVMRAIGASNLMILQIFLGEGLLIGMLSWFFGSTLSLPVSKLLSDAMGSLLFRAPLSYHFSLWGVVFWFAISLVLAFFASFIPAWSATRVTVRDVLAYE